jgi:ribonuclease PH
MTRPDSRAANALRPVAFEPHFTKWAEGSVLTKFGDTHVLCNVSIEDDLPSWLKRQEKPHGWLTAEYRMLPRSTQERRRDRLFPGGRTQEISRLIGRSLRMALDLHALGPRQLTVDCTVLQADGGTRTAAITGGWVAVALALRPLIGPGVIPQTVHRHQIAAVSVGIVDGQPTLDLAYEQDSQAAVDCNVVMTVTGSLVEVQSTGERAAFDRTQFDALLDLAAQGIRELAELQTDALSSA